MKAKSRPSKSLSWSVDNRHFNGEVGNDLVLNLCTGSTDVYSIFSTKEVPILALYQGYSKITGAREKVFRA
jgi:hypothetical protein